MSRLVQASRTSVPRGGASSASPQIESLPGPAGASKTAGAPQANGGQSTEQVDEYASRMIKYIPSEVLAGYLTLESVVTQGSTRAVAAAGTATGNIMDQIGNHLPAGVFLLGLVFTPLYIWSFSWKTKAPWGLHAAIATLAFCIWAYAMRGIFFTTPLFGTGPVLYHPQLAAGMLVIFSLISGLIKPSDRST